MLSILQGQYSTPDLKELTSAGPGSSRTGWNAHNSVGNQFGQTHRCLPLLVMLQYSRGHVRTEQGKGEVRARPTGEDPH